MDEIQDQHAEMQQIHDALGQALGAAADIDEDELEAELAVRGRWLRCAVHGAVQHGGRCCCRCRCLPLFICLVRCQEEASPVHMLCCPRPI